MENKNKINLGGIKQMLEIKVMYHTEGLTEVQKIEKGDWIDLRSAETVEMKAGDFKLISLGVSMELPTGYEAHMAPRSSAFKTWGILQANSIGIIDESYKGEEDIWKFPALAMKDTVINKNDRICQFRIVKKMDEVEIVKVSSLSNANRGGLGSSTENDFK